MFFAQRTRERTRLVFIACLAFVALVAVSAAIFPHEGQGFVVSFGWWLAAIPVGLLAYALVESFGTWGLGRPFWQRMPSWARVLLLVVIIGAGTGGIVLVRHLAGGAGAP